MKLKSAPEDFQVEEQTDVVPSEGPFAFYRLSKQGLGTPEAVQEILRIWGLPRNRISYGGLKDRHAQTMQHLTIHRGPRSGLTDRSFGLEYLGQVPSPFGAKDIASNRFKIRLRGIDNARIAELSHRAEDSKLNGLINYFDDQRFGSIGYSGELIGVPWCKGDYERALYLSMAEANPHDRPREKEQKGILRDYWGQWEKCKAILDRSHRRSIVTYLVDHPVGFKRALALVRQDLRGIYVAAFQSWVWNRWLSSLIEACGQPEPCRWLESKCGPLALPVAGNPQEGNSQNGNTEAGLSWSELSRSQLPLPSAREHQWPAGTLEALQKVLEPFGMEVREMRLKYPRDTFFSKGQRSILLRPTRIESDWEPSLEQTDRSHWRLQFELPRGAYATMVVRQWTLENVELEDDPEPSGIDDPNPDALEPQVDASEQSQ